MATTKAATSFSLSTAGMLCNLRQGPANCVQKLRHRPAPLVAGPAANSFKSTILPAGAGSSQLQKFQRMADKTGGGKKMAHSFGPRAAVAASPASTTQLEGKLPGASDQHLCLDKDTLRLALNAALLSSLAYKTPVQVEYLRLRANGNSQEAALKDITQQHGGLPADLDKDTVAKLEADNERLGFTDILATFDEPSQYFDGKQSLFMEATVAYMFFCPTAKGQRNVIYVVFRGTEGDEDKITDLQVAQVEVRPHLPDATPHVYDGIGKIKLHLGFRDQFVAVSTALTRNVEAAAQEVTKSAQAVTVPKGPARLTDLFKAKVNKEQEKKSDGGFEVVVAGHSLGAGLATIGSFIAALEHPDVKVSYFGFGSPRVGNPNFAAVYKRVIKGRAVHFANKCDPVTGVPIPPHYVHVLGGHMLDEDANGKVIAKEIVNEENLVKSAAGWLKDSVDYISWWTQHHGTVPWSQHDMGLYVRRVRALYEDAKAGK